MRRKFIADFVTAYALQVELIMPVVGASGRVAHAQVQSTGEGQMDIQVQLPDGRLLRIDPHESAYDERGSRQ